MAAPAPGQPEGDNSKSSADLIARIELQSKMKHAEKLNDKEQRLLDNVLRQIDKDRRQSCYRIDHKLKEIVQEHRKRLPSAPSRLSRVSSPAILAPASPFCACILHQGSTRWNTDAERQQHKAVCFEKAMVVAEESMEQAQLLYAAKMEKFEALAARMQRWQLKPPIPELEEKLQQMAARTALLANPKPVRPDKDGGRKSASRPLTSLPRSAAVRQALGILDDPFAIPLTRPAPLLPA